MKKRLVIMAVVCWLSLSVCGCVQQLDPVTGEEKLVLKPEVAAKIDAVAKAAAPMATMLAMFFPALYPLAGIAAGAAGAWAKMRPKLKVARNEADMYYAATESLVEGIEQWKADNPAAWTKLRDKLGRNVGDNTEAVIRAIRGLPLKD